MRWFEGGIAEAVATSKSRNAIFVVFIEGKDDASRKAAGTMNNISVSQKLESEDFVAIKLESESEAYRQFAQIYQLVPVPSLFFIGGNGVPLEVVAEEVGVPELLRRINSVLQKSGKISVKVEEKTEATTSSQEPKAEASESNPDEARSLPEVAVIQGETKTEIQKEVEERKDKTEANATSETLTTEEKLERAKELIEKKRKLKEEEEEQNKKLKELERRKMGQEVQKLRRWQQDQDLKQLKEERQKEKAEEAAARERILKQIAQDRAERATRFSAEQEAAKRQADEELRRRAEQQTREAAAKSDVARIQFRLPDGSASSHNFEATATLGEVRAYAATQLNFPFRNFTMSTTFPRRELTSIDDNQTVRDLQLVPTAVILILPISGGTGVVSSSQGYSVALSRMVWSLFTPLFSILNYLRNFIFGGGAGVADRPSTGHNTSRDQNTSPPASARTQNSTGARRRIPGTETTVRREGNVHRLGNRHDSSDDENNTWNGNSTQQM